MSANWFILTLTVGVYIAMALSTVIYQIWPLLQRGLPKVISAREMPIAGGTSTVLLLERSELFGFDAYVSIDRKNGDFEEMIALGQVLTIQQNGLIQIVLRNFEFCADQEFLQNLRAGNLAAISNTLVKPTVPQYHGIL